MLLTTKPYLQPQNSWKGKKSRAMNFLDLIFRPKCFLFKFSSTIWGLSCTRSSFALQCGVELSAFHTSRVFYHQPRSKAPRYFHFHLHQARLKTMSYLNLKFPHQVEVKNTRDSESLFPPLVLWIFQITSFLSRFWEKQQLWSSSKNHLRSDGMAEEKKETNNNEQAGLGSCSATWLLAMWP